MLKYNIYTCRLRICNMFDEMLVMDSRVLFNRLFIYFLLHHNFPIILLLWRYYSIMCSDLGSRHEKVAEKPRDASKKLRKIVLGGSHALS